MRTRWEYNQALRWLDRCQARINAETEATGAKAKRRNRKLLDLAKAKCDRVWIAAEAAN